jgi:hypothetical protein
VQFFEAVEDLIRGQHDAVALEWRTALAFALVILAEHPIRHRNIIRTYSHPACNPSSAAI